MLASTCWRAAMAARSRPPRGRARECDATESTTGPEIHGGVTAYARARCRPKSIDHARVLTRTGPVALEVGW